MSLLSDKLKDRIRRVGQLSFRDFMESALYDPELGYYNTPRLKIGPAGDYYTSSNVHAAFGASLACQFAGLLDQFESAGGPGVADSDRSAPGVLTIVEVGPGTGQLAHDILTALDVEHPELYSRIKYVMVERSAAMERRQREKLSAYSGKIEWAGTKEYGNPGLRDITGIVFSNELVDAFPVHVVRKTPEGMEELYVTLYDRSRRDSENPSPSQQTWPGSDSVSSSFSSSSGEFWFSWGTLSCQRIQEYIDRMGVPLSQGQVIEVNLDAIDWLLAVSGVLNRGWLITIDYGDVAGHLYGPDRPRGTLRAFNEHTLAASVLDRVGEQDITSSVDFTALMEYGRDAGLETVSYERQSAFLLRMGLIDRIARVEAHLSDLKDRLAIKNLFVPGGASDNFRVLIQSKGEMPFLESL
jgi:SAM-dependent MidA family methyltransferase